MITTGRIYKKILRSLFLYEIILKNGKLCDIAYHMNIVMKTILSTD
ncbi:Uncharacterized protein dnm_088130 [Desulfonema magnum]|uniref:Uncharacterized protein n=1 Tax=Desulfonema magnum TaxID=45655 RepID=A0A975BX37_9BACT|nr:Uncharacterized protein dnm_088130 [Desulfonema magnum]